MGRAVFKLLAAGTVLLSLLCAVTAQELRAIARVDPGLSKLVATSEGLALTVGLSQPVPYRIETRVDPMRLVIEFREVDFAGSDLGSKMSAPGIEHVDAGPIREGWSQIELFLKDPMALVAAEMIVDQEVGSALLDVVLAPVDEATFLADAVRTDLGLEPQTPEPVVSAERALTRQRGDRPLVVMLDPGHGGFDPGAERDGYTEADLMLQFGRELQDHLVREAGHTVLLTRTDDEFVPLPERVARARAAGADVFLSLHADALIAGEASGARVYTLSEVASDEASARLAEQLDRASLLAGMDLTDQDDTVATALMDLARTEVQPRSNRLADELVAGISAAVGEMHRRPRMSANFSVLRAPDIPSALIELGFLSSDEDLERLLSEEWRAELAEGIRVALQAWVVGDAAEADLIRQ
ncbi:MAG: N-acetylmuramoyl-L-alanine amidase [Dinoroseobacter sp.]|nr:N-acetylmuramoyl-L-alanine amidase [Dinoroseobacter sp.]